MSKDTASRKWQITINNPVEHGMTHDKIKELLGEFKKCSYWCMADEIGENETYHTHVYIHNASVVRFSSIKKRFPQAHIEHSKGTAQQNREYITKTGKWLNDRKHETCVEGTFEEFGECPVERQGSRNDLADLYGMIKEGYSDYQILEQMPESLSNIERLDKVRQILVQEEFKEKFRELEVHYVHGDTGTGKTRTIMERHGYSNVFRVTDYSHPFDNYKGQDIVVFEEFRSSFSISDMLNYLDGYPLELPCRYNNKFACYTKVYIVTNIPLGKQYTNIQREQYATWLAFLRRISGMLHYTNGKAEYSKITVNDNGFTTVFDECPFDI